mgnify:CR=1 FL=1
MVSINIIKQALLGEFEYDLDEVQKRTLDICKLRISGVTLDEIGNQFGLTRERVRQLCESVEPGLIKRLMKERKLAQTASEGLVLTELGVFVRRHPGITNEEILENFPKASDETISALPKSELKLVRKPFPTKTYPKQFSDDDCFEAIRTAGTYFFPLTHDNYNSLVASGEIVGPSVPLIYSRFGSWSAACARAGVESRSPSTHYTKNWSEKEITRYLVEFLSTDLSSSSIQAYDSWRPSNADTPPAGVSVRKHFGGWPQAIYAALSSMREGWTQS